jgi:hypothetical protein
VTPEHTPRATVREIDGQLILDDPDALAMIRAVGKHNCRVTFDAQRECVERWQERMAIRNLASADVVIVLLNVDDPNGAELAQTLMPGHNWQQYRDRGEVPFARGLAGSGTRYRR